MTHEQARESLSAFHDGELPEPERALVEAHLASCGECRAALEDWRRLALVFLKPPQLPPSEAFVRRVMARIGSLERPAVARPWVLPWLVPALGAGLASLFLSVSIAPREPISTESLLLADAGEAVEIAFLPLEPMQEDMLGYALEGP